MSSQPFSFPEIFHISQVQPYVENTKEFALASKGPYTYVCYKRVLSDTFPTVPQDVNSPDFVKALVRLECRGLVFDNRTGQLVSRSFHKFFNIGERKDSGLELVENIFKGASFFNVLEKLDGSMCTPIFEPVSYHRNGDNPEKLCVVKRLRFRTKMGFDNPTSQGIEKFIYGHTDESKYPLFVTEEQLEPLPTNLSDQPVSTVCLEPQKLSTQKQDVVDFSVKWLLDGYSPIFEFFGNDHKIVISYEQEFVQLLALRHVASGKYMPYDLLKQEADCHKVPIVPEWSDLKQDVTSIADLISKVKVMTGKEGCVICFPEGQMFKIKSTWYMDLHRCKQHLKWNTIKESHVWRLVLEDKIDDTIPTLDTDQEREKLLAFNDKLLAAISKRVEFVNQTIANAKQFCKSQRDFSDFVKQQFSSETNLLHRILYRVFAGDDAEKQIIESISACLKKGPCDEARKVLGDSTVIFEKLEKPIDYREFVKRRNQELLEKQNTSFDEKLEE